MISNMPKRSAHPKKLILQFWTQRNEKHAIKYPILIGFWTSFYFAGNGIVQRKLEKRISGLSTFSNPA